MSARSSFMPPTVDITDLQYAVIQCGLPLELVAKRTGMTVGNLMRELKDSTVPDWLVTSARRHPPTPEGSHAPLPSLV